MEWSTEKRIQVIKEFERHDCLWKVSIPEYKNVVKKKDAGHNIGIKWNPSQRRLKRRLNLC